MIVRYALRQIRRKPGFSFTVIVTLALSIGANLAVFQLLQAVLFAPLPVANPSQLYALHFVKSPYDGQWFYSYPAYQRLRQSASPATPVIAHSGIGGGVLQAGNGFSEETTLQMVSPDFFAVLGLSPASGRFFASADAPSG